jgi:hypothetical protein
LTPEGKSCPEHEHALRSAEGRIIASLVARPGLLRFAGQAGRVMGLDHGAALSLMPDGINRERAVYLLGAAEGALISVMREQEQSDNG